jgi:hypothetical protein
MSFYNISCSVVDCNKGTEEREREREREERWEGSERYCIWGPRHYISGFELPWK